MRTQPAIDRESLSAAQEQRLIAATDLLRRLPDISPQRIGNVRGGRGAVQGLLARRFPGARIETIEFTLETSRGSDASPGRDQFRLSHPGGASPREGFDLIFCDGSLEMLATIERLTPALLSLTRPRGVLAFQLPNNLHEPNRELLRLVAVDGPWAKALIPVAKTRPFNVTLEDLDALLRPLCESVEFWQTTYVHYVKGAEGIIESMKDTSLPPFLEPLDPDMRQGLLQRFARELAEVYRPRPDGKVLLRLPRISLIARR